MVQQEQCRNQSQRQVRNQISKKTKEKKPPQRGRGIPELERMILEEQQQKKTAVAAQTPSIPLPLPFQANLPLPTPNFNPLTPISSVHLFDFHPFPMPPDPPYGQGGSSGRNLMDFVNYDEAEKGSQQKPSSMVNIPESPPFSSGVDLQMELPSFQIYISEYSMRMRPEDDGIVNLKRGHPSSLNDPPDGGSSIISFRSEFPSSSASCHRRYDMLKFDSCNDTHRLLLFRWFYYALHYAYVVGYKLREGPLSSSIVHGAANNLSFVKTIDENGSLDKRICTLGCPAAASKSKPKQPTSVPSTNRGEVIPSKGSMDQSLPQPQPFYNFFPMGPSSDEDGSAIDLNLKL